MSKIGVFGLWHLGCVIATSWSNLGHYVIGYDYDFFNIADLSEGKPPIFEPFLEDNIKNNINNGSLRFTSDQWHLKDCDYVFLAYDTPVDDNDDSDTSILEKSIIDLSGILKDNSVIIVSSQSPIGFCNQLESIIKSINSTLNLAYSPENLRLGEAIKCYMEPERIILGTSNKETEEKCLELFKDIKGEVMCMSFQSAEMVKHGINSFLAMSIVFANTLSEICFNKNSNIEDVIKGIKSDPRIGKKAYLSPGIGFSGGTLGRDLKVLSKINGNYDQHGTDLFGFIHDSNIQRKYYIINRIRNSIRKNAHISLKNKNIGVLGLTYKAGTSTLRRSIPLEIVNFFIREGSNICVFDPNADYKELTETPKFEIKKSIDEVIQSSDYIVILNECPEFKEFDWSSVNKNIIVFDTKNILNLDLEKIEYHSL